MGEELLEVLTEKVQPRIAVGGIAETVLGAATVAGEKPLAGVALWRETITLVEPKAALLLAIHHRSDSVMVDIAKQMFRKYEMVARIEIAICLEH